MPGETLARYKSLIYDEQSRLQVLHHLELATVRFGLLFLRFPTSESHILDAGCGAGGSAILIHQAYGCRIDGITLSSKQAELANKASLKYGYNNRVVFSVMDMTQLSCEDNMYDRIWVCESSEHVSSLDQLFGEFKRVAKPGARLVLFAWCSHDPEIKKQVDEYYLTDIHPATEYQDVAGNYGWQLVYHLDLTQNTASYWQLRSYPYELTKSEKFMTLGFLSNNLQYHFFVFDLTK